MHIENCYLRHGVGSHRQFRTKNLVKILVAWKIMIARVRKCPDITTFKSPFVYKSYLWVVSSLDQRKKFSSDHSCGQSYGVGHGVGHGVSAGVNPKG